LFAGRAVLLEGAPSAGIGSEMGNTGLSVRG
jgi:hypothetical protein